MEVVDPEPGETVHDPACGTGGFLLSAYEHMRASQARGPAVARKLRESTLSRHRHRAEVVRLCAMNLYLHGIGGPASPVDAAGRAADRGGERYDIVLTNPPFGKRQSFRIVSEDGGHRQRTAGLRPRRLHRHHRQQAAQLPPAHHDNHEGGRLGRGGDARQRPVRGRGRRDAAASPAAASSTSTRCCACRPASSKARGSKPTCCSSTGRRRRRRSPPRTLWVYDLRTNQRFTLRERPLQPRRPRRLRGRLRHSAARHERKESERFHRFPYDELAKRDKLNLDIFWLKDDGATDPDSLPPPDEVAAEIVESLELALEKFRSVALALAVTAAAAESLDCGSFGSANKARALLRRFV